MSSIVTKLQQRYYSEFAMKGNFPKQLKCPDIDRFKLLKELDDCTIWSFKDGSLFLFQEPAKVVFY